MSAEAGYLGDLRIPAVIYQYGTDYSVEAIERGAEAIGYRLVGPSMSVAYTGPWAVLTYPC